MVCFASHVTSSHPGHDRRIPVRPSDAWLEVAGPSCADRREWAARVKQGERDLCGPRMGSLRPRCRRRWNQPAALIGSLMGSLQRRCSRRWHRQRKFLALQTQADDARAILGKLESDGVSDSPIGSEAGASWISHRGHNRGSRERSDSTSLGGRGLVRLALSGDEKSRAELEKIATSQAAGAFPAGFSALIAASRFDKARSARFRAARRGLTRPGEQSPPSLYIKDTSPCHTRQACEPIKTSIR